jgi:hypothetical protein
MNRAQFIVILISLVIIAFIFLVVAFCSPFLVSGNIPLSRGAAELFDNPRLFLEHPVTRLLLVIIAIPTLLAIYLLRTKGSRWSFFTMSKRKIAIAAALIAIGFVWVEFFPGLELPPSLTPPAKYDPKSVEERIIQLNALTRTDPNRLSNKLAVEKIIGENASPEDLAMLAIWAEQHDPWVSSQNQIYSIVFYTSVVRLGDKKDQRSKYALWKVRNSVALSGHFDADLAETLDEMQERQNRH